MNKKFQTLLIIISGPSGVGKTVVAKLLTEKMPILKKVVTCTTRPKRPHETNKREYVFLSEVGFRQMIKQGAFLEWAQVHGKSYGELYGTPKKEVNKIIAQGKVPLLVINVEGALAIKEKGLKSILIFIKPESLKQIQAHMKSDVASKKRGNNAEEILLRLHTARKELKLAPKYALRMINKEGKLEETVDKIKAALEKILKKQYK